MTYVGVAKVAQFYMIATTCTFLFTFVAALPHYAALIRNHCSNPQFLPSISSIIGDTKTARITFRLCMAIVSPPRLILFWAHCQRFGAKNSGLQLLRLIGAAGWIFIASNEHLLLHTAAFAIYAVASIISMSRNAISKKFILLMWLDCACLLYTSPSPRDRG